MDEPPFPPEREPVRNRTGQGKAGDADSPARLTANDFLPPHPRNGEDKFRLCGALDPTSPLIPVPTTVRVAIFSIEQTDALEGDRNEV